MVRSLYSGVAGMKVHQARMDVVGNNIANVNTYGFKASRATFSDLYYQTLSSASNGSASAGGTNPSQIGYGVQFGGVDLLMERAAFTSTDRGMDVAIAGEGFFQVQDSEGNTFYTRAGVLSIDTAGNLVDGNGNFVLGIAGSSIGKKADDMKIQLSVPAVTPTAASATEIINDKKFTVTSSNRTKDGNISFKFISDDTLPGGLKAKADITISGITVRLNSNETFYNLSELNTEVNRAITEANGGKTHPAGNFTIATEPANVFPGYTAQSGNVETTPVISGFPGTGIFGGVTLGSLGTTFSGRGDLAFKAVYKTGTAGATDYKQYDRWELMAEDQDGKDYFGYVVGNGSQTIQLKNIIADASSDDYIQLAIPDGMNTLTTVAGALTELTGPDDISVNRSTPLVGGLTLGRTSPAFSGTGSVTITGTYLADNPETSTDNDSCYLITATMGTLKYEGYINQNDGPGTVRLKLKGTNEYIDIQHQGYTADLISHIGTAPNTPVTLNTDSTPTLAITATPSSPFIGTGLSGKEIVSNDFSTKPGTMTGIDEDNGILGGLQFSSTSSNFTVPNDSSDVFFEAVYEDEAQSATTDEGWRITATVGTGKDSKSYTGYITTKMTGSGIFLLRNEKTGEYIEMSHPGITEFNNKNNIAADTKPSNGLTLVSEDAVTATSAQKSNALGLGNKDITLAGGTEGGAQSVSDLTNLAISSDGTITATHPVHGTIELGRIILATFENPQGLEEAGNSYFTKSANSGDAKLAVPGESGTGALVTSALEMSNVDLSKEFTEMITTQRGFQANSRVITVSDTLLEELINLKR